MMQVALGNRGRKEIKFVAPAEEKPTTRTFSGPEVRRITMVALPDVAEKQHQEGCF